MPASSRLLVLALLPLLATPAGAASRRAECVERCAEAVAACSATCGSYGELLHACRRALVKRCLREGPSVCSALAGPPTTTLAAPGATTSTTAAVTTTTSSTTTSTSATTTTLAVRERSASLEVAVFDTQSRLTVDVRNGPLLDFTVEIVAGSRWVCLGAFHLVQGTQQVAVSAMSRANACLASPPVCDRFVEGVVVRFTCGDLPSSFDPSAPFVVDWAGDDLVLP